MQIPVPCMLLLRYFVIIPFFGLKFLSQSSIISSLQATASILTFYENPKNIIMLGELAQLGERVVRKATCNQGKQITKNGNNVKYGELAQLGERVVRNHEVRGSIPLFSTTFCLKTLKFQA